MPLIPSTGSAARPGAILHPDLVRKVLPVAGGVVAALVGYFMVAQGIWLALLVLGACLSAAFLLLAVNRFHLTLAPYAFVSPFAGYVIVLQAGQGFSLVFDFLTLLPFAVVLARWASAPERLPLFAGGQLLVWGFIAVAMTEVLSSEGPGFVLGLYGLRRNVLPMLVLFVGLHVDISRRDLLRRCASVFVWTGVPVALWGLKQHFIGPTSSEYAYASLVGPFWVDGDLRVFSTFTTPWGFSAYLTALGLVSAALVFAAATRRRRGLALAAFALFTTTLLFTYMRAPLLGYAVGLVFLAVRLAAGRLGKRWAVTAFLVLLGSYVALVTFVGPELQQYVSSENIAVRRAASLIAPMKEEGMQIRFATWQSIWPLVVRYPLGIGVGTTGGVGARFEGSLRFGPLHTDNLFLAVLVETGWIGGALFLAVILWVFARGFRRSQLRAVEQDQWIGWSLMAFLIAMTIAHLATPLAFEPGVGQLYWLASGMVANASMFGRSRPLPHPASLPGDGSPRPVAPTWRR